MIYISFQFEKHILEYVSNGYYYTYDDTWSDPNSITTIEGTGYYPQATRNYMLGLKFKL